MANDYTGKKTKFMKNRKNLWGVPQALSFNYKRFDFSMIASIAILLGGVK